ncbi:ATP-dependent metallopeptidase FtsH/Yme1/Tma family protein [Rhizobium leguminosarum]|nr:ATP-dependent metallopeptidase FtsH/Yme1/Tma family protein [Rhizobium leguminosarum]
MTRINYAGIGTRRTHHFDRNQISRPAIKRVSSQLDRGQGSSGAVMWKTRLPPEGRMERKHTFSIGYFLVAMAFLGLFQLWLASRNTMEIAYSDLMHMVADGKVQSVTLSETMIQGVLKASQNGKMLFISNRVDPVAAEAFEKAGVQVSGGTDSNWLTTLLSWVLPTLLFLGVWIFLFR